VEHLCHDLYSLLLSNIDNLLITILVTKTMFIKSFGLSVQIFGITVLVTKTIIIKSFGLIVRRFDITGRIRNALFRSLKRFGGRTVGFITVVTAVIITITSVSDRDASAVGSTGKLG